MVRSVIQTQETNWPKQLKGIGAIAEDPLPVAPLTESERGDLEEYEKILEQGLATFFEVGNALLSIREKPAVSLHRPDFRPILPGALEYRPLVCMAPDRGGGENKPIARRQYPAPTFQ